MKNRFTPNREFIKEYNRRENNASVEESNTFLISMADFIIIFVIVLIVVSQI